MADLRDIFGQPNAIATIYSRDAVKCSYRLAKKGRRKPIAETGTYPWVISSAYILAADTKEDQR